MIDLIGYPQFTDKCRALIEANQYTFDVHTCLTKTQIKQFIEEYFNVDVVSVNTHLPARKKHKSNKKRAIVRIANTQSIDM